MGFEVGFDILNVIATRMDNGGNIFQTELNVSAQQNHSSMIAWPVQVGSSCYVEGEFTDQPGMQVRFWETVSIWISRLTEDGQIQNSSFSEKINFLKCDWCSTD